MSAESDSDAAGSSAQVEAADVIRLILQFLKESNLKRSLQCLQEESSVCLGAVDNKAVLRSDIIKGRWDAVVQAVGVMRVPEETLYALYEQIVCELIEQQQVATAKTLLEETTALQSLQVVKPFRYRRLENFIKSATAKGSRSGNSELSARELYEGTTRDKKRAALAKTIMKYVEEAPPSRLVALLGMALRWQSQHGLIPSGHQKFSLFHGRVLSSEDVTQEKVERVVRTVKFGKKNPAQCVVFSPDGRSIVTGSSDGLIECWDWTTGKLATHLKYQTEDNFMAHASAVLALAFSPDFTMLATGCKDGHLKVWDFAKGQCLAIINNAHEQGICCITFNAEGSQILSGSYDYTASQVLLFGVNKALSFENLVERERNQMLFTYRLRLHGIVSGNTLRQFSGHTSYVNGAIFNGDGSRVITGSSDGNVKVWDAKTGNCLLTFTPPSPAHMNENLEVPVQMLLPPPKTSSFPPDSFLVCTKTNTLYLMNESGQVLQRFCSGKTSGGDFVTFFVPPSGSWVYCAGEDRVLYTFSGTTGILEAVYTELHQQDILGLAHHPVYPVMASISFDGYMHILEP